MRFKQDFEDNTIIPDERNTLTTDPNRGENDKGFKESYNFEVLKSLNLKLNELYLDKQKCFVRSERKTDKESQ